MGVKMTYTFGPEKTKLLRVVDGDTVDLMIDLGFGSFFKPRIRFRDVDTPEIYNPKSKQEYLHGMKAKSFVEDKLKNPFSLTTFRRDPEIYGRWVGEIYYIEYGEEHSLSQALIAARLTKADVPYFENK